MSNDLEAPAVTERQRFGTVSTLGRFALVGATLAAVVGTFAYFGGWFTPNDLTPARLTDAFEQVDGVHPGFRRNHAKGLGVSGFFKSNGNGVRLSKAVVFRPGRLPVVGRFSLSGGQPDAVDMPNTVRGLGLAFSLPDGELWRTAMINLPVFPVSTPEAFYERLLASKPDPKTGKPDPAQMKSFLSRHPEAEQAMKVIKGRAVSSGFGDSTFQSLNAFRLMNAAGGSIPVRWLMTPEQSFEAAGGPAAAQDKNYLFDALIAKSRGNGYPECASEVRPPGRTIDSGDDHEHHPIDHRLGDARRRPGAVGRSRQCPTAGERDVPVRHRVLRRLCGRRPPRSPFRPLGAGAAGRLRRARHPARRADE